MHTGRVSPAGGSRMNSPEVPLAGSQVLWSKLVRKFGVPAVERLQSWPQRCSGTSTDTGTQLTCLAKTGSCYCIFWFLSKETLQYS